MHLRMELAVERMTEEERKAAADQLRRALGPVGRSLTELQNLSHSASFHPKDKIAPSKRGIEQLVIWNSSSLHYKLALEILKESACGECGYERPADRAVGAE